MTKNDTPTLDDALNGAFEEPVTETEEVTKDEVSSNEEEVEVTEETTDEHPEEDKQVEDSFTEIDPNKLPEELKAVYKSLQGDYTRKRQLEAEEKRTLEAKISELERRFEQQGTPEADDTNKYQSPEEAVREIAKQTFIEQQNVEFEQQAVSDFIKLDERLDDNPENSNYDSVLDEWLRNKLNSELQEYSDKNGRLVGFEYKGRAKELIESYDKHVQNLNKRFVKEQTVKARESESELRKASPKTSNADGKTTKAMSLDDALNHALLES